MRGDTWSCDPRVSKLEACEATLTHMLKDEDQGYVSGKSVGAN